MFIIKIENKNGTAYLNDIQFTHFRSKKDALTFNNEQIAIDIANSIFRRYPKSELTVEYLKS